MPLLSQISCENPFRDLTGGKKEISHSLTEEKNPRMGMFIQHGLFHNTVTQPVHIQQFGPQHGHGCGERGRRCRGCSQTLQRSTGQARGPGRLRSVEQGPPHAQGQLPAPGASMTQTVLKLLNRAEQHATCGPRSLPSNSLESSKHSLFF